MYVLILDKKTMRPVISPVALNHKESPELAGVGNWAILNIH